MEIPETGKRCPIRLLEQKDLTFIGAAIAFILLHIYPVGFLPLRTWSDEPSHASSGIQILQAVSSSLVYSSLRFEILQWFSRLIVIAGVLVAVKYKPWKYFEKFSLKQKLSLLIIPVFFLSHLVFFILKDVPFYEFLYKPPPISRWLSLGITTLAEPNVFWARLPSLLFCLLASALIYEIVTLLGYNDLARIAAIAFLFFPNVSYMSSNAVPGGGTVFFSLLPLYFLFRFFRSKDYRTLYWCFFWVAVGFLWKRFLIIGDIYIIIILAIHHIFVERIYLRKVFIYWLFSLGMVLPFVIIGQFLIEVSFNAAKLQRCISFSPVFYVGKLSVYLQSIPMQIGFLGVVVFLGGLILFFARRTYFRKFWPFGIVFLCWYVALTLFLKVNPRAEARWQLPLYPFIALCLAFCFRFLISRWRRIGMIVFGGYLLFMILCSTFLPFSPLHKEYALYRTDSENPGHLGTFLPYEEMVLYMKKNLPAGSKVMADDFPDPREFYSFKHHLNVQWVLVKSRNELLPGIESLYGKAKSEEASYLFLPESVYTLHLDKSAVDGVFQSDTVYFSPIKVFSGPGGRVGLFSVK